MLDLFSPHSEQWTDQFDVLVNRRGRKGLHSGETIRARTAQKPQKEQFDLIVGVMCEGDDADVIFPGDARQEFVSNTPCDHLDRSFARRGHGADVRSFCDDRQVKLCCHALYQSLVGIAASAAQLMVQVRNRDLPSMFFRKPMQNVQEHHRIHAAGDSGQDCAAPRKESGAFAFNFVDEPSHNLTLDSPGAFSQDGVMFRRILALAAFSALAVTAAEQSLLYVTMPGTYYSGGTPGILIFDIGAEHKFVRRVPTPDFGEQTKGFCGSALTKKLYVSSTKKLWCFDLKTEKVLWERGYEKGCDRMAITPDGKSIYMPSIEGSDWKVIDGATGDIIKSIEVRDGPHNTLCSLDGTHAYLASLKYNNLTVVDTRTHTVEREVGPFSSAVRPFTVNGSGTLCYVNINGLRGFEVGDLRTGQKLHRVEVPGGKGGGGKHGCPSHGVGLTPDEREIWVTDSPGKAMQVFDGTSSPPKHLAEIALEFEPGWINFSIDGRYAYPSTADIIETKTRKIIGVLKDEHGQRAMSEKLLQVKLRDGSVTEMGNQFAIGRKRSGT
jgi:DNA-binding beta-propeller fold protein YncE